MFLDGAAAERSNIRAVDEDGALSVVDSDRAVGDLVLGQRLLEAPLGKMVELVHQLSSLIRSLDFAPVESGLVAGYGLKQRVVARVVASRRGVNYLILGHVKIVEAVLVLLEAHDGTILAVHEESRFDIRVIGHSAGLADVGERQDVGNGVLVEPDRTKVVDECDLIADPDPTIGDDVDGVVTETNGLHKAPILEKGDGAFAVEEDPGVRNVRIKVGKTELACPTRAHVAEMPKGVAVEALGLRVKSAITPRHWWSVLLGDLGEAKVRVVVVTSSALTVTLGLRRGWKDPIVEHGERPNNGARVLVDAPRVVVV